MNIFYSSIKIKSDEKTIFWSKVLLSRSLLFSFLLICFSFFFQWTGTCSAQTVGIFGSTSLGVNSTGAKGNASSVFDISATGKGILIPRMTAADITAMNPLPAAAQGLLVYQTDGTQGFYYNTSITTVPNWVLIAAGGASAPWTRSGVNVYLTNNASGDSVGIGTAAPNAKLHIKAIGQNSIVLNVEHSGTGGIGTNYGGYFLVNGARGAGSTNLAGYFSATGATNNYAAIFENGNVGIGTTAPGTALDIIGAFSLRGISAPVVSPATQGRIYFDITDNKFRVSENTGSYVDLIPSVSYLGTSNAATSPQRSGEPGTGFYTPASGQIGISTFIAGVTMDRVHILNDQIIVGNWLNTSDAGGTSLFTIEGSENAPSATNFATLGFSNDANNAGQTSAPVAAISAWMRNDIGANRGELRFKTKDGATLLDRMTIDMDGYVGIGTDDPASLFTVGATNQFQVNSSGNIVLLNNVTTSFPAAQGAASSFLQNDGAGILSWTTSGTLAGGTTNYLPKWTSATALSSTSLLFEDGTYVGIGTSSPSDRLHIAGTANTLARISSSADAAGTLAGIKLLMYASALNTHYDIATEKTDAVPNSGASDLVFRKNFSTAGGYLTFLKFENSTSNVIFNSDKTTASDYGDVLFSNGNVGIGTTAPDATLHSVGSNASIISDYSNTTYTGGGKMYPGGSWNYSNILGGGGGYTGPDGGGMPGAKFIGGNGGTSYGGGGAGIVAIGGNGSPNGRSGAGIFAKAGTDGGGASDGVPAVAGYFDGNTKNAILAMNGNVGIGTISPSTPLDVNGVINSATGYRIAGNAASGNYLRGNGTNFVSSAIQAADLPTGGTGYIQNQTGADQAAGFRINGNGIFNGGNVGIGSLSPGAKLDVATAGANPAISAITTGTLNAGYFQVNNASNASTALYATTNGTGIALNVSNTNTAAGIKYSIYSSASSGAGTTGIAGYFNATGAGNNYAGIFENGNVGIGTTTPLAILHIQNSGSVGFTPSASFDKLIIENNNASEGSWVQLVGNVGSGISGIGFSSTTRNKGAISYAHATNSMFFNTNSTTYMTIGSTGKVGIGTTNPAELLYLKSADSDIDAETNSTTESSSVHFLRSRGTVGAPAIPASGDYFGQMEYKGYDGSVYQLGAMVQGVIDGVPGANDMPGRLEFYTTPDGSATSLSRMTIKNDGDVGIGTTAPIAKLDVRAPNVVTASSTAGNLHVMTTNAQAIDIGGSISLGGFNDDAGTALRVFGTIEGRKTTAGTGSSSGYLAFKTNNTGVLTERMRVDNLGNVGIGTTAPGYRLTVNGEPAANGYTAFTNYSDARLKKNILSIGGSLDKIMQLRPVQFNYNEEYLNLYNDTNTLARVQKGFIAQEVKEIFPEMVGTSIVKDKEYFDLNLSNLQIYLVKAMQEQQVIIDSLKKTISRQQSAMDEILIENANLRSDNNTFKSDLLRVNGDLEKIKEYLELKTKK